MMEAKYNSPGDVADSPPESPLKQAEEALQLYQTLFQQSPIPVALSYIENGEFIDVNNAFLQTLGYARDEVVGKTNAQLGLYVDPDQRECIMKELMVTGGISGRESPVRRKDGSVLTCSLSARLIESQGKRQVLDLMNDITGLKRAEEKHRVVLETALDGFWINDLDGRLLEVNDSYCRMVGYTREELLTMSIPDIEAVEKPEETGQHMKKLTEQGSLRFESRHKCKDGRMIDVEISAHYVDTEGGQVVAFVRDITERKRAEQALGESELKYRTLVENIPQKIFLKDRNSVYLSCNSKYAEDLSMKPEEITGHTDFDFYPRDLAEKYRADDKRVVESGNTEGIEERYIELGQERIVETLKAPVRDEGSEVVGVLGVFHDITERKRAEEALRESEARYRLIADNTSDSIWALGPDLRMAYQSPSGERIFGYTSQEWQTMGWSDFVHPDYLGTVTDLFSDFRHGREEGGRMITVKLLNKDGRELWAEISASPIRGQDGEFAGVVGVTRDVSERVRAEQELLEYKAAVEQSGDGIALTDMDGHIRFVNEAWASMHGRSVEELMGRHLSVFHTRRQMDTEVIPFNRRLLETGANRGEVWHVRKNGEEFPTFMTTTVFKGAGDRPFGMLALLRDISGQKESERQRREQEIAQARAEELSESRRRLINAQEALRRDIAGKLHGTVQSRLILLGHRLAELEAKTASETMAGELADIRHRLEELQDEHIRPISHRLFPSILRLGLCVGLEALTDEYSAELSVDLQVSKRLRAREQADRRLVPDNVKLSLYRIAQEALANILKHTSAVTNTVVKLSLSDGGILRLTVSDDGAGFDKASPAAGIGLAIISDYAVAAGGSCAIKTIPGKGTQVRAEVPIAGPEAGH